MKITPELFEALAAQEHVGWSAWMLHQFKQGVFNTDGTWTMPKWAVDRWQRQMTTVYPDLSETEKESDRQEVRRFLEILK